MADELLAVAPRLTIEDPRLLLVRSHHCFVSLTRQVIAEEIVENLAAALDRFEPVAAELLGGNGGWQR